MKNFLAIIFAVMFVFTLTSCSKKKTETPQVTDPALTTKPHKEVATEPVEVPFEGTIADVSFTVITVDTEDFMTRLGDPITGTVTDVNGMAPTVLDAAKQVFDANSVAYEEKDGMFTSIKGKAEGEKEGYEYVWEFKVNGGPLINYAASTLVEEGDHIVFYLNPYKK